MDIEDVLVPRVLFLGHLSHSGEQKSKNTLKLFFKSSFPEPADQIQSNLVQIILG
jgi:hypothetical protein